MHRIGILGAGHFAMAHMRALRQKVNRARVTCVARRTPGAPCSLAEEFGVSVAPVEAVLASPEVDAVLVCTPNYLHARHAVAALRAGKHVFCEKPMALSVADAEAMSAAAKESGRVLMVGHLTRHAPLYTTAADVLFSGRLGRFLEAQSYRLHAGGTDRMWRMDPQLGGGVVFDLMIHDLDLIRWLFGPPLSVSAEGQRHALGAFDSVRAVYALGTGGDVVVEASFRLAPGAKSHSLLRVVCDRGELYVDGSADGFPIEVRESGKPVEGVSVNLADALGRGLSSEWDEFLDAVDGTPPSRLRIEDAYQAVLTAVRTIESVERGGLAIRVE